MTAPGDGDFVRRYYESIEIPFRETKDAQKYQDWVETLENASIFLFAFSLIPGFPFLASSLMIWLDPQEFGHLFGVAIVWKSIFFWWCVLPPLTLLQAISVSKWETRRRKKREKKWLPRPQMRFAYCYSIVEEIRKYLTNQLDQHIDAAMDQWHRMFYSLRFMLHPYGFHLVPEMPPERIIVSEQWPASHRTSDAEKSLFPEILLLQQTFGWFKLEKTTEEINQALNSFGGKLHDRLKDKKNLAAVADCLEELAGYLYSRIPEVSNRGDQGSSEALSSFGTERLISFARKLNALAQYSSEPKPEAEVRKLRKRLLRMGEAAAHAFSHENMAICFVVWYFLTGIIVLAAFKIAFSLFPSLQMDSIIASTMVGAPLAAAVTAIAVSRNKQIGKAEN